MNFSLAQKVAEEIGGIAIECNVADETSAKNAIQLVKEKYGVAKSTCELCRHWNISKNCWKKWTNAT